MLLLSQENVVTQINKDKKLNAKTLFKKYKIFAVIISYLVISFVIASVLIDSKWAWAEYASPLLYPLISVQQWQAQGLSQIDIIMHQAFFNTIGIFIDIFSFVIILTLVATASWLSAWLTFEIRGTPVSGFTATVKDFWRMFKESDLALKFFDWWQKRKKKSLTYKIICAIGNIHNPFWRNVTILIFSSLPGSILPLLSSTAIVVTVAEMKHLRWREWTPWLIAGGIIRAIVDATIAPWLFAQILLFWNMLGIVYFKVSFLISILISVFQ